MQSIVVAIAGPSGSGKTWLTTALAEYFAQPGQRLSVSSVAEDAYYREQSDLSMEDRLRINYDHPDALEHDLLLEHLRSLRAGESVKIPDYDYVNHTRAAVENLVEPAELILVEGVHLLHDPRIDDLFDLRIYLDTPLDLCLLRRIERDVRERGRTEKSVREQFSKAVVPMYHRFVLPARQRADLVAGEVEISGLELRDICSQIESLLPESRAWRGYWER